MKLIQISEINFGDNTKSEVMVELDNDQQIIEFIKNNMVKKIELIDKKYYCTTICNEVQLKNLIKYVYNLVEIKEG